jgi:quercetin dioxygenase-like cupin family protein
MYEVKRRPEAGTWGGLDLPGVTVKVLRHDEATGAMNVLTRIAAGACIPAHSHSRADDSVFVVEGEFVEDGETYGPGSYFFGPAGTRHGPHSSPSGCTVLTHFWAELDLVE